MSATIALPGFADPVGEAQATFRAVLDAMARPGRLHTVGERLTAPAPLDQATAAVLLTLVDNETPLWLDAAATPARDWLAFHCGAAIIEAPERAAFAVALSMPDLAALPIGTHEAPEEFRDAYSADRRVGNRRALSPVRTRSARTRGAGGQRPAGGLCRGLAAEPCAVSVRRGHHPVRRRDACRIAAQRVDRGGLSDGLCHGQGRRAGDRQCACMAGRGAARRSDGAGTVAGADRGSARPQRGSRDGRRFAVRQGTCRAGREAGAGRSDRGGFPAARLSHDIASLRARAAGRHRDDADHAAHLGGVQGSARRTGARSHL